MTGTAPDPTTPVGSGATVALDAALRARVERHLATFRTRSHPADALRRAAVAITIVDGDDGHAALLLTRRATTLRAHAGQWAIPGGRIDEGETPEQAALRELEEEVGLTADPSGILGRLDDYATRSGYAITPVVLWVGATGPLVPNPAEVASIHRVALAELDRPDSARFLAIPESDRPVVQLSIGGDILHAPTAAVLYQLREVALHGRATRVAHLEQPVFAWK